MKKLFSFVLCICMLMGLYVPCSYAAERYGDLGYQILEDEVWITYCVDSVTIVEIPAEIEGYPVTGIEERAFSLCADLTTIIIPDSVISIPRGVFSNTAYYNNDANWENGVLYIGNRLIEAKTDLSGNYSVKSGTKFIDGGAFMGCTNLISITIPDGLKGIGHRAFEECTNLTNITIPDGVTVIEPTIFVGCTSLTNIAIPDSVTSILRDTFSDTAYYNNETNWENGVLYIGNRLIEAKTDLSGNYSVKSGTKFIDGGAFMWCTNLTNVTIPSSVINIGDIAFQGCTNITSVIIPDGVTKINFGTFRGCTGLTNITIPNSVKSVGVGAFQGCAGLTNMIIPNSVTNVGDNAFAWCTSLTSVTISESITSIELSTFDGCTSLTSIMIPDGVTIIDECAFVGCTGLGSVVIPKSVTKIGYSAFGGCEDIAEVYYNGADADWNDINIEGENEALTNAIRKSIFFIKIIDENNKVTSMTCLPNETIDMSGIKEKYGEDVVLCTDEDRTVIFDTESGINGNMTLYISQDSTASEDETVSVNITCENGTVTGAAEYTKGSSVSITTTPNNGYKFDGWYNGNNLISTDTSYTFTADTDIALTAKFSEIQTSNSGSGGTTTYTVSFETNGGSKISNKSVRKNTSVSTPAIPSKNGYTFAGWYSDEVLTTPYDFSDIVKKNITLYAKWIANDAEEPEPTDKPEEPTKTPFSDVKADAWYADAVKFAVENGLMNGVSDTEFAPNATLTRAMLVTILYRNDGEPETADNTVFEDVATGSYYEKAVAWAKANGIVDGYSETEFAPDANITREQIATIMHRYATYKNYDVNGSADILDREDYAEISDYAVSAMQYMVASGLMNGKTNTTLDPQDNATRAEIATILQRFITSND